MVIIEEIKRNKKSYTIVVNGETLKNINIEVALSYAIKEGEMENEKYREFLKENEKQNAKAYLYSMISRKSRTIKEARERLYQKGYHKEAVEYAINTVSSYGYLDDEAFAENFIENAIKNKGTFRIKRELKERGVSQDVLENAVKEIDHVEEEERALASAKKYLKGKSLEEEKTKEKLFRHLVSRGYSYEIIKRVMRMLNAEICED